MRFDFICVKFNPKGQIASKYARVEVMAWCVTGTKPFLQPVVCIILFHTFGMCFKNAHSLIINFQFHKLSRCHNLHIKKFSRWIIFQKSWILYNFTDAIFHSVQMRPGDWLNKKMHVGRHHNHSPGWFLFKECYEFIFPISTANFVEKLSALFKVNSHRMIFGGTHTEELLLMINVQPNHIWTLLFWQVNSTHMYIRIWEDHDVRK